MEEDCSRVVCFSCLRHEDGAELTIDDVIVSETVLLCVEEAALDEPVFEEIPCLCKRCDETLLTQS
jgi:hypothetical protein